MKTQIDLRAWDFEKNVAFNKEHNVNWWLFDVAKADISDEMKERIVALAFEGNNAIALHCVEDQICSCTGKGYAGYSMSNNALKAYEYGEKPLSKFNAQDAREVSEILGQKITLKQLKKVLEYYGEASEHHTSKYYNTTTFYSFREVLNNASIDEVLDLL